MSLLPVSMPPLIEGAKAQGIDATEAQGATGVEHEVAGPSGAAPVRATVGWRR